MTRALALLVLMLIAPSVMAQSVCAVWHGTITTDAGLSGNFRAHTRHYFFPGSGPEPLTGPFRCRGLGCPGRRGRFKVDVYLPSFSWLGEIAPASHQLYCVFLDGGPAMQLAIDAGYTCYSRPGGSLPS